MESFGAVNSVYRRVRYPQTTIRGRLTLLYGGLFLACGVALLTITYLLVEHTFPVVHQTSGGPGTGSVTGAIPNATQRALPGANPSAIATEVSHYRSADLHKLITESAIALGLMVVVSIVLGWIVAGRVLRPLRTITTATQHMSERNLHQRLALQGPDDELKQLGDTIDALLARLDRAFDAQRRFVANASHELRTPVTVGCTLLEMILGDPHPTIESFRATCIDVLESEQQQAKRIEALLTLAQGQADLDQSHPLDLAEITDHALHRVRQQAHHQEIEIHATLAPAATVGNRELINRLIANLLDNAVKYNTPHGRIDVTTAITSSHAELIITNTGPIVPPDAVAQLFQPFHRLTTERTDHGEGTGLGLSIVKAIADTHHATINAAPQPTGGLKITIHFPDTRPSTNHHQPPRPTPDQARPPITTQARTAPHTPPRPTTE